VLLLIYFFIANSLYALTLPDATTLVQSPVTTHRRRANNCGPRRIIAHSTMKLEGVAGQGYVSLDVNILHCVELFLFCGLYNAFISSYSSVHLITMSVVL
jgi:hypothetical protein